MSDERLNDDIARQRAGALLSALWPDWSGTLCELGPVGRSAVFRVLGAPIPAVVKLWCNADHAKAHAQAFRQSEVAQALRRGPHRAPDVLHFDKTLPAMVMQDCDGLAFDAALSSCEPARAEQLVEAAGGWIAALHATSLRESPFRPVGHLNWLDKLLAQAEAGDRQISDLPRFRSHCAAMHEMFQDVRRKPTIKAVTHKDLNAGNLLLGQDGTLWGIDFENAREDEPLRDLFTLGVDVLAFAPFGRDRHRALATLARGYGDQASDPAVRLFLQRTFALGLWARTPERASKRQKARLAVTDWILEQDSAVF